MSACRLWKPAEGERASSQFASDRALKSSMETENGSWALKLSIEVEHENRAWKRFQRIAFNKMISVTDASSRRKRKLERLHEMLEDVRFYCRLVKADRSWLKINFETAPLKCPESRRGEEEKLLKRCAGRRKWKVQRKFNERESRIVSDAFQKSLFLATFNDPVSERSPAFGGLERMDEPADSLGKPLETARFERLVCGSRFSNRETSGS